MKASYRWLDDVLGGSGLSAEAMAERLALRGAPVEGLERPGESLADVVVGRVITAGPHPNADRLSLCTVDGGAGVMQVVCGAPNVRAGAWYPFAPVGAVLPGDFKIKKAKIRGEVSEGMLCSAKELRLGSDHAGILELHGHFEPGQPLVQALGLDDVTLEVEITANRGDLLSHVGLARELADSGSDGPRLPLIPGGSPVELEYATGFPRIEDAGVSVEIRDADLCPRYLGAVVRGVRVGPSPAWLQARLRGAGARPITNVVDATNYVMLELGQPLHAFDLDRLAGSEIVVRRPAEGERTFVTLDDEERRIGRDMLMICDRDAPVAIAGVMGGRDSEVTEATADVLIECAWFEPKSIRATRRALNMSTDASYRFERGIDPEGMRAALERCVTLVLAVAGGSAAGTVLDCAARTYEPETVALRLSRIAHVLGVSFTAERVRALLSPLGFEVGAEADGTVPVRVPGFRSLDVRREIDLIEEVARTHGYDAFPADLGPYRPGSVPDHPLFALEDELRAALAARGLLEAQTPAFVPAGEGDVEVSNPLATTEPFVRRTLLPSLVRRVEHNLARGNRDVRLFELGTSFRKAASGEPPEERPHLAVVMTGRRRPPHWSEPDQELDVYDLTGMVEDVVGRAYRGRAVVEPDPDGSDLIEPGSGLRVRVSGPEGDGPRGTGPAAVSERARPEGADGTNTAATVGRAGRMRAGRVDVPAWAGEVWGFELTLPEPPLPRPVPVHEPLPAFPASERDLALLVPDGVRAGDVMRVVRGSAGPYLEHVEVFDLYRGPGVPDGTRSIGHRLRFRARDRTLQDAEIDAAVATVLKSLGEELGVQPRA